MAWSAQQDRWSRHSHDRDPTWLGHLSSVAQRVLEGLDLELPETDGKDQPSMFGKVAVSVVQRLSPAARGRGRSTAGDQPTVPLPPFRVYAVGAGFDALREPVNPVRTVAPGAMAVFHDAAVTVTRLPLCA